MRRLLILLAVAVVLLAGCGGSSHSSSAHAAGPAPARAATLVLDFTPNAVHAGIYTALARGYDRAAGVKLHVIAPSASTDAIRLLETGRVNFAILDIHDLAIARQRGENVVGILPIVERPLAAVLAQPSVRTPRQLVGKTVGVTGDPSDNAVLDSIVRGSGASPSSLKRITIGFNAVGDLLAGRVAAATGFWNDEAVTLNRRRPGFHVFRVDDYGAPSYPELVVCASAQELKTDPSLARAVVSTLVRGYDAALADPATAAGALESRVVGLDPSLVTAELKGLLPAFRGPGGRFGVLDPSRLKAWARWESRFGIVKSTPDVATMFDTAFAPRP
jgi:putative hydroxymethylpyrimidine transport system substrate-binding protein